ncbi:cyclin-dependent kinase inhibitor 5-like [Curcuma longa]|uniref:cyclin-dependent kinase inhibitor 5-like n=1 Tax=Curcuma longa TaxID=136217 RepID=UPI003D9F17A8
MGKYMRKDKQSGEVAIVEVAAHQPSLGVRTRSRALAAAAAAEQDSPLAYLELRSRRLEKPLVVPNAAKLKATVAKTSPASIANPRIGPQKSGTSSSGLAVGSARGPRWCSDKGSPDVEVSCDENVLELDSGERGALCSLIRDVGTIGTPGSTTNSTYYSITSKQRKQSAISQYIPSNQEMEEFFVGLEKPQHEKFIEKYNFDPVNDCPLPGPYEWEKLDSW